MKQVRSKTLYRIITMSALAMALIVMSLPEMGHARKKRKLPINSYISGAKIAYGKTVGDEGARPYDALALLDSCTMWYGMIPEAYFWETLIHSDLAQQTPKTDTAARKERIIKMIGAADSLVMGCDKENKDIKKKYKKKCKPFMITADSIRSDWFSLYYNDAQEFRTQLVDEIIPTIATETDPDAKADLIAEQDTLLALINTSYEMASLLATSDTSSLLVDQNLGNLYLELQEFEKAIPYFDRAAKMAKTSDPGNYLNLLNQGAYTNFQAKKYLEAAKLWNQVADEVEDAQKIEMYGNILACFDRLDMEDSTLLYNHKILGLDPTNATALGMLGGNWFNNIQALNKENAEAKEAGDKAKTSDIKKKLALASDSATYYLKRAFEADTTDVQSIELYAITSMLKGDKEAASVGWAKLTALKPDDKTYWIYLGDNYIARKMLKEAIVPYEKAIAIDASAKEVWSSLVDLYSLNNMPKKLKAAKAKVDELNK